mgnify:CR=1 FL=1
MSDSAEVLAPAGAGLALVGDVHANLAALESVLGAVADTGLTRGVLTGDLVMRGPDPAGVIARVRALGWPAVAGNTDIKVAGNLALGHHEIPPRPKTHPASSRAGSRSWTIRTLDRADLGFLAELPIAMCTTLGTARVAVVHGSPRDPSEPIGPGTSEKRLRAIISELGADCIVTGHTHRQHAFRLDDVLFVNPGAVGEGRDGERRPRWGWLEATDDGVVAHLRRTERPLASVRGVD